MFAPSFSDARLGPWVECFKMQGSGNDFVLLDNRSLRLAKEQMFHWAKSICQRAFGVGADGLIFLDRPKEPDQGADYIWHFFNADGSRAEMCGNGSRCAARLAWQLGMAPRKHVLDTDAGLISAYVLPKNDLVKVQLTPYQDLRLNLSLKLQDTPWDAHFVNTGVPHLVLFVHDVAAINIQALGKQFRHHPRFSPAGTNVNFAQVVDNSHLLLRTYERGVEGETLACGTGAAATALISSVLGRTGKNIVLRTSGQEELGITLEDGQIFLTGKAILVFAARLYLQSLGLDNS